jgi:hypothetical protein
MATTHKRPSEASAANTLKRFFSQHPDAAVLTVSEALEGAGRGSEDFEASNQGWLSNKLTALYYHDLVKPIYTLHPYRKLDRLQLTTKGRQLLDKARASEQFDFQRTFFPSGPKQSAPPQAIDPDDITIELMLAAAERINKKLTTQRVRVVLEDKM